MDYTLKELLDVARLRELLDSLDEIHNLPSAIVDIDGNILTATAWQDLCTKFHRSNPETEKKCIESDRHIEARLDELDPHVIYRCPMGLVDAAIPIIIEGKHLGNVYTGQLFTEAPDEEYFQNQARQYGFDETAYIEAMRRVPLFSEEKLRKNLTFIHRLTQMLAEQGLQFMQQCEAERELRESQTKYQRIFQNLQDVYYETTLDGILLEISPSIEQLSHYTREELIGTSILDAYVDDQERESLIDLLKTAGRVNNYEIQLRDKFGVVHVCSLTVSLLFDDQGLPFKIVGSLRDISASKQVEEALRVQVHEYAASQNLLKESEERFKALHDASFGGVIIHDKGLILDCNQGLAEMTGFRHDELVGMNGLELIAPDSLDLVLQNIKSGYEKRYEGQGLRKDGSIYPLSIRGKNVRYKGLEVRVIEFRDISERKQAEAELRAEQFRLSEIIRGTNVGTWEWNVQTSEVIFNERWAEIFGYTCEELLPTSIDILRKFVHPDDLPETSLRLGEHFSRGLDYYECEFRMKHKDGRWIWVVSRGKLSSRTDDGEPLLMFGTHSDVDERKRLEEEHQTIEKLNTVGTLAGGIAHDFNNILAGLYGNISLAKIKLEKGHAAFRFLESAEKSMNRATLLTNQLLTFAKGGEPVTESLSLEGLVDEVVRFNLSGSNVKPIISVPENLWLAKADQGQIQQVFGNLAINAKQATPDGGHLHIDMTNVEIAKNSILGLAEGRYIRITLADEGCGIATEHLERIFEPYFTTKQTGSGLGLATIYSIINKHGGHINVASQLGTGTTFTLYLPASELSELGPKEIPLEPVFLARPAKILIMDDEEVICRMVTDMLEEINFTVETAAEGLEAVELYQQALVAGEPFDLVILDLTVPGGMGGKEASQMILKLDSGARMIVSSGYADDPIMANHTDYGFSDVIAKPYDMTKLAAVLARAWER